MEGREAEAGSGGGIARVEVRSKGGEEVDEVSDSESEIDGEGEG